MYPFLIKPPPSLFYGHKYMKHKKLDCLFDALRFFIENNENVPHAFLKLTRIQF